MKVISNAEFGGERPLFESHDLRLESRPSRSAATSKPLIAGSRGIILSGMCMVSLSTVVSSMSEDVRRYGTPTI